MPPVRSLQKFGISAGLLSLALILVSPFLPFRQAPAQPSAPSPGPLHEIRIVIDPGHGGIDGGCCYGSYLEKTVNLAVAKALQLELQQLGASVKMTRTSDVALAPYDGIPGRHRRDLAARVKIAQQYDAHLYISIHANTGPSRLSGSLTFFRRNDDESRRLASLVQDRMSKLIPGSQNGILPARFAVLTGLDVPAILIELGFLTNSDDRERLQRPGAVFPLAAGVATGILDYIQGKEVVSPVISPYPVPEDEIPHDCPAALPLTWSDFLD